MLVTLGKFVGPFQLFGIFVLNPQRLADFLDNVLVGSWIVAAGSFITRIVRLSPVGVDVAGGQRRTRLGVLTQMLEDFGTPGTGRRRMTIEVER